MNNSFTGAALPCSSLDLGVPIFIRTAILSVLVLFGLFLPQQGRGDVVVISSLEEVLQVDRETLVILDIDDTLLYYPYDLGSEMWFRETWEEIDQQGNSEQREEAIAKFHEIAALLAQKLDVAPVEEGTCAIVRKWQSQGALVMAVTARALEHPALEDWQGKTLDQLKKVGISFRTSSPPLGGQVPTPNPSSYREGVLFLGPNNKGVAIALLLGQMAVTPKKVVIIDDRKRDIDRISEALEGAQVPFVAYWYRAQERRYAAYSRENAVKQLRFLEEHCSVADS